jgi:adenylate cyclase
VISLSDLRRIRGLVGLAVSGGMFLGVLALRQAGFLQTPELDAYDRFLRLRPALVAMEPPLLLVRITEDDIQRLGHPLPDALLAHAVETLLASGPRAIGVDVFRDLPVGEGRERLAAVVTADPRVVMIEKLPDRRDRGVAAPGFLAGRAQVGFNDLMEDAGGIVRRGLLILWDEEGRHHLSLSLSLALQYLDDLGITLTADPADPGLVRLGDTTIPRFRANDGGYVGADDGGYQYLLDYRRGRINFPELTLSEVLAGDLDVGHVRDRIVILGTTSPSVQDYHHTPLSTSWGDAEPMPGIMVHAHAADQLLRIALADHSPTATLASLPAALWILIWSSLGGLLGIRIRSPVGLTGWLGGALAVLMASAFLAFCAGWWLPAVSPGLAMLASAVLTLGYTVNRERAERRLMMQLFGRYVSLDVAKELWEQREQFLDGKRPRPQELTVTVMMTDLEGYTPASEELDPVALTDWINTYMDAMARLVAQHGGIVDDYAGDGLKADFGVPIARKTQEESAADAAQAVRCSLAMGEELKRLNARWRAAGLPTGRARIGIHTGPVVAASLGSAQRLKYTTIGDTVNVASRLESFDKDGFESSADEPCRILLGEETFRSLDDAFRTQCIGVHQVRGRREPITIYRLLGRAACGEASSQAGQPCARRYVASAILILGAILALPLAPSAEDTAERPTAPEAEDAKAPGEDRPEEEAGPYIPPLSGSPAPRIRASGGTRGLAPARPVVAPAARSASAAGLGEVTLLIPEHMALTVHEAPVLYWHVSRRAPVRIQLVAQDDPSVFAFGLDPESGAPMLDVRPADPIEPGIHALRLADYGIRLPRGRAVSWSVAILGDLEQPEEAAIARGRIELTIPGKALRLALENTDAVGRARLYARNGIWYDAIAVLSEGIAAGAADHRLRVERAALLEQVGLEELAEQDLRAVPGSETRLQDETHVTR